jgi:anti-sigma factor RsiW
MSERRTIGSDDKLHAYVDGALPATCRADIKHALERDSAPAARCSDYYVLKNLLRERCDQRAG